MATLTEHEWLASDYIRVNRVGASAHLSIQTRSILTVDLPDYRYVY